MNKDWKDVVIEVAEDLDWKVTVDGDEFTFQRYSSYDQDFSFEVEAKDLKSICNELDNYCDNFDVSYEAYLWLDETGHGKNGAPYDMEDVYKDMEECKDQIESLYDALNDALDEWEDEEDE